MVKQPSALQQKQPQHNCFLFLFHLWDMFLFYLKHIFQTNLGPAAFYTAKRPEIWNRRHLECSARRRLPHVRRWQSQPWLKWQHLGRKLGRSLVASLVGWLVSYLRKTQERKCIITSKALFQPQSEPKY